MVFMMKMRKNIAVLLLCPLLLSCIYTKLHNTDMSLERSNTIIDQYTLDLPKGFKLTQPSNLDQMMDFDIYELRDKDGKIFANIYLGNAPNTSLSKHNRYLFNNFKTKDFNGVKKIKTCGVGNCGEILIYLNNKHGEPQFAHIFFQNVTDQQLIIIQRTIESLENKK